MKNQVNAFFRRLFLLFITASLLLSGFSGCKVYRTITGFDPGAAAEEGEKDVTAQGSDEVDLPLEEETSPFADKDFTLNYNYSQPLNPYTCSNRFNLLVGNLVYESLYTYDADFHPQPMLAESAETDNGRVWRIKLKRGVTFHDGHELVAKDVIYALRQSASATGVYYGRFSNTFCLDISEVDTYELRFTLAYADWDFLRMLDVPILQTGSATQNNPVGTGPYRMTTSTDEVTGETSLFLTLNQGHRDAAKMPIDRIYLREYNDGNLSSAFSDGYIDLLEFDPVGLEAVSVQMDHETRYYNTPILQYLGFNHKNYVLSDASIRQPTPPPPHHTLIVDEILNGKALASPLILSPALDIYDPQWETELGAGYDLVAFSTAFSQFGMADVDQDGFLEYPHNGWTDFSLRLLVNNDNSAKIAVAERIAASLRSVGVDTVVEKESFSQYIYRLNHGDFDLYIAEVRLPADFNPGELLRRYGVSNYGGITEARDQEGGYTQLIQSYLGTSPYARVPVPTPSGSEPEGGSGSGSGETVLVEDDSQRRQAAYELCRYVYQTAPIIPICYKKYCVISHRNVVYNLHPSKSNVFRNFAECTITMQ